MRTTDKLMNAAILRIMIRKGQKNIRTLEKNTKNAIEINNKLLLDIISNNADTEYGKKYHFADIHSVEDYKQKVPVTDFEDYRYYIDRMKKYDESNLITSNPIVFYAMSSGSCGIPKDYPVCQEEIDCYSDYASSRLFGSVNACYKSRYGKNIPFGKGLNTIVLKSSLTEHGIKKGWISCAAVETFKKLLKYLLVLPDEAISPKEGDNVKYLQIRYALMADDITFMVSNFMVYLVELINYAKRNWELLCNDIEMGTIDSSINLNPETRTSLERKLKPLPKRAEYLRNLQKEGFSNPIIQKIWPNIAWIGAVGTNNFAPYTEKMRAMAGENIIFDFMQYGASESLLGCARKSEEKAFVLIPDSCYYEFIPVNQESCTALLDISQVEVGKEYELVITNKAGLYRYRMMDVVKIIDFWNEMPMVQCVYRKSEIIRLTCEKTTEYMINWVIQTFIKESGINLVDFAIYGDTDTTPPRYNMFLELENSIDRNKFCEYERILESKFEYINDIYCGYVKDGTIAPLKLFISKPGTHAEYISQKVDQGAMEHQVKPAHVLDTKDKQKFFLDRVCNFKI